MAGKRRATSDLNHDNWNQEDEPEESGNFTKASENILKDRVTTIAKQKNPVDSLASSQSEELPKSNGVDGTRASAGKLIEKLMVNSESENLGKPIEYYAKIKGLNQSVSKWIQENVDQNPFLNLTPIFRDYEKYLEEIEMLNVQCKSNKMNETAKRFKAAEDEDINPLKTKQTEKTTEKKMPPLQLNPISSNTMFNLEKMESSASTGLSFRNNLKPTVTSEAQEKGDTNEDEDEVEFIPVVEDGHM